MTRVNYTAEGRGRAIARVPSSAMWSGGYARHEFVRAQHDAERLPPVPRPLQRVPSCPQGGKVTPAFESGFLLRPS